MQNLIFRFLQSRQKVQIWLYEQTDLRIEGRIIVSKAFCRTSPLGPKVLAVLSYCWTCDQPQLRLGCDVLGIR